MIFPIVAYGDPVLKKKASVIFKDHKDLDVLISSMYETMYNAFGVGLAAPQIGQSIRLFLVDTSPFAEDEGLSPEEQEQMKGFKQTFINAEMIEEIGDKWVFNEGCLSIPNIREDVFRPSHITIKYLDENFVEHIRSFDGLIARVIQHEYDHIEGVLFTDRISSFKKRLIKNKLINISKGKVDIDYKMRFPISKKSII